ncbi:efflux RND transporter periplasmic adaptor subunit [Prevotella ihumii]|uniref:efflux RND transporter periplasmic adaptor subunit n=1 Tax=Prevotella ihumii TaxID=1917878 RepID=UPI0009818397|nr:HlyD family efflux transporter periplasmic adaptor subunit [Prevotella ihumii]
MDIEIKQPKYIIPRKYWLWIAGGILLVGAIIWLALNNMASSMTIEKRKLNMGEVRSAQFDDYVSLDGCVVPIQVVQISPEEGGVILERIAEEGAHVRKGDVIVKLTNSNLNLEILNAESELAEKQNMLRNTQISMEQDQLNNQNEAVQLAMEEQAKARAYSHQKALKAEDLISREDYLKAKEDYELAMKKNKLIRQRLGKNAQLRKAQVEQMNDNLSSMVRNVEMVRQRKERLLVRSQIDGEVGQLDVELGQSISPGQKIGVINDLSDYKIEAKVDEHYIDRVRVGLTATFQQNGTTYRLRVRKVFPEVKDSRFKIEFTFEGARPKNIRTGQTYYVDLTLGQSKKAILIPKGTFYSVTGGSWIFVLDKDGQRAYRRNIRIGRQNEQYYEVLEGLEAGETVITSGYEAFKNYEVLKLR